jgi:hypothetical protein
MRRRSLPAGTRWRTCGGRPLDPHELRVPETPRVEQAPPADGWRGSYAGRGGVVALAVLVVVRLVDDVPVPLPFGPLDLLLVAVEVHDLDVQPVPVQVLRVDALALEDEQAARFEAGLGLRLEPADQPVPGLRVVHRPVGDEVVPDDEVGAEPEERRVPAERPHRRVLRPPCFAVALRDDELVVAPRLTAVRFERAEVLNERRLGVDREALAFLLLRGLRRGLPLQLAADLLRVPARRAFRGGPDHRAEGAVADDEPQDQVQGEQRRLARPGGAVHDHELVVVGLQQFEHAFGGLDVPRHRHVPEVAEAEELEVDQRPLRGGAGDLVGVLDGVGVGLADRVLDRVDAGVVAGVALLLPRDVHHGGPGDPRPACGLFLGDAVGVEYVK